MEIELSEVNECGEDEDEDGDGEEESQKKGVNVFLEPTTFSSKSHQFVPFSFLSKRRC